MQGHLLADIGKAIIAAGIVGLPSYFIGIPLILAYLLAGVIIGPHLGFGLIQDANSISNLSEIGLVLLMFILGLEINLKKLLQTGKTVLLSGAIQIVGCLFLALAFFGLFAESMEGYRLVYLTVACSLSSTLIVVKILSDQMDLDSIPSRITLGVLVLQDLFAIGFLALQPNLSDLNPYALLVSGSKVGLLVLISWILARFVLPLIFKKAGRQPELMLILAMTWCFAMCGIASYLGLSLEMGALIAGISIASFPYHLDVAAKISSLRDFFITLFFVGLGLQIPMPSLDVIKLSGLVISFVLVSRVITIYPVLHRMGYANRASLLPAINLSQLSEFSIVLATLGVTYNHINQDLTSVFIISLVVSALISSFLIPGAHNLYRKINPLLERIGLHDHVSLEAMRADIEGAKGSAAIVFLGFFREASSLLYEMQTRYSSDYLEKILVVDFNPEAHQELKKMNINCQYGDVSNADTLRHLNLQSASIIICSIPDKILKGTTNLKMLKMLKQLAPDSSIVVTSENIQLAREMYAEGASYVFLPRVIGANYLADVIERLQMDGSALLRVDAQDFLVDRKEVLP